MKRQLQFLPAWTVVAILTSGGWVAAQNEAAKKPAAETTPEQDEAAAAAAKMEAELGKYKDSTPEAADLMVKLVDYYHAEGQVFGLTRIGQRFIAIHTNDPRHQAVMLKLIDGLDAGARNKELVATCRQFLQRYPESPAAGDLEQRLAVALEELLDYHGAGDAYQAVWKRNGANETGLAAAMKAVTLYIYVNDKNVYNKAADLAFELTEKLPDGPLPREMAYLSMLQYQRGSEWAKANRTGTTALTRGLAFTPDRRRWVHYTMGENYARQSQFANAVDSFKKARAEKDGPDAHYLLLSAMASDANTTPNDMAPVVQEYLQKYPDRRERFTTESWLAGKYRSANQKPQAQAAYARLLEYDARTANNAVYYLEQTPNEPADHAAAEQALIAAIGKNPDPADKAYLRYLLALNVYRDRLKDIEKAKATLRTMINEAAGDNLPDAMNVLLSNAASDQEFQQDVALSLASMKKNLHLANWRGYLGPWAKAYGKDEKVKARADFAIAQATAWENDPLYKTYTASEVWSAESQAARDQLIKTGKVAELIDPVAAALLSRSGYFLRHYAPGERRAESAPAYGMLAKRFPKEPDYAWEYLVSATDYGPKELSKEAALHYLTFEPKSNSHETFRRLFLAVDQNADVDLARQALAFMQKAEKTFGLSTQYAFMVGDTLAKLNLKAEAEEVWKTHLDVDPNSGDATNCSDRLLALLPMEGNAREQFLIKRIAVDSDLHGYYAGQLAAIYLAAGDLAKFEQTLTAVRERQKLRPFRSSGISEYPARTWVDQTRADAMATPEKKRIVFTSIRDLQIVRASAMATLALWDALPETAPAKPIDRLRQITAVTRLVYDSAHDWDTLMPYVQAALTKKDYLTAATLAGAMLSNINGLDAGRQQSGRAVVAQSYSRLGAVGLTIDERSELAPLMQAALYLRLGDRAMALDSYTANKALFDSHRDEVPFDLLQFVCESLIAVGGDENHDYVEEVLRGWLVKNSENAQFDAPMKASVQLLLARNFDRARRYDIARSEYATILNRYPDTPQAIEAEFGIGEAFMAQKVYDQAEAVFEKLAVSRNVEIVIRAEFLRGVLAYRRGDKDEARGIFKGVLERVPSIELANQALFNLAEVYKDEERYIDQLNLLRTVGRLGKNSKRTHAPGVALSIVVQDSDLGISRGHSRIPVTITTQPGGDQERVFLTSGGAGKGLFRTDLETRLGQVAKGDGVLQLSGKDVITCDYPDEFKLEFKSVPLSDVEIRVAADGRLRMSSGKIIDEKEESFSERLERENRERQQDLRVSQARPSFQIKPGNQIYLRVDDADRDFTDAEDNVVVKLTAESGDTVQVSLKETGSHTGVFEATAATAELPAGALAKDMALEHPPVMAIDQNPKSFWMSEPDGAAPKWLTIDMKDLKPVSRVRIASPQPDRNTPVRGELLGSYDGEFWYRLASQPPMLPTPAAVEKFGRMRRRVYPGNYTGYSNWNQVTDLSKNGKPLEETEVDSLAWLLPADAENAATPYAVLWDGKLVQERAGAVRLLVNSNTTAIWIDGYLELPFGYNSVRTVDLWLERGTHDLMIFAATVNGTVPTFANIARADASAAEVRMLPFRASDFNLDDQNLKPARKTEPAKGDFARGEWTFAFTPRELRHVKFVVQEYVGEAVAISTMEIGGEDADEIFIPTKDDVLSLSTNQTLEIAGGDVVTGAYTDEATHQDREGSRLLTEKLTATYFNAFISAMQYDFERQPNGQVVEIAKQVMRVSPGDRFIVEIIDYDLDVSAEQDAVKFDVIVNDNPPIEYVATETEAYTGRFRKEIDTSAMEEAEKIQIKAGDRIYIRYIDSQNTFPGHAVPREAVVYANTPSAGRVRILETRVIPGSQDKTVPPQFIYHTPAREQTTSNVAFEAPLTVEVIDPDAARDSRSEVIVKLVTPTGANVDVRCVVSGAFDPAIQGIPGLLNNTLALEEGRFIGQVIMQLGGKNSPQEVPVTSEMPRNLIGGTVVESGKGGVNDVSLVTRVLNLTGQDTIVAGYKDEATLPNSPKVLKSQARLISNGKLRSTDRDYEKDIADLHVGEKIFLMVTDPDQDRTDERDVVEVEIATAFGDKEKVPLEETLAHSGIFTGSVTLQSSEQPEAGNFNLEDAAIECYFGDTLTMTYRDPAASTEEGTLDSVVESPVVIGTDGLVAAFSKTFNDEKLAVETKFTIAESYFELFKSHKELGRSTDQKSDLEAGRRVLREVMEDYPDPKYVPRIAYLLGQFSQELGDWDEAVSAYRMIIDQYPEHTLAPDAQYKLAQAHEERGDFDEALEAYVTLAATYPKSPLIASVMIRICDHFYKAEEYRIAAQVGEKFIEKFDGHQHASRIAFRIGQCFYKAEDFVEAGKSFDRFAKNFPEDTLTADSLFWAGESYRKANSVSEAFRRYNRCRWDFPASEAAKFARGRLALPEMLQQFESEANAIENQ